MNTLANVQKTQVMWRDEEHKRQGQVKQQQQMGLLQELLP